MKKFRKKCHRDVNCRRNRQNVVRKQGKSRPGHEKTLKKAPGEGKPLIFHSALLVEKIVFFQKVGPREQTSEVFGRQNGSESDLWDDISGPKIDKNSGLKKRGSQIEKSDSKKQIPILGESLFGSQGPRKWTVSLNTRHS